MFCCKLEVLSVRLGEGLFISFDKGVELYPCHNRQTADFHIRVSQNAKLTRKVSSARGNDDVEAFQRSGWLPGRGCSDTSFLFVSSPAVDLTPIGR